MDETASIRIGGRDLNVWLATTDAQWRRGLAGRSLDGVDGMLFVFPHDVSYAFHSGDTSIALLLMTYDAGGHLADGGLIVSRLQPRTPYRYALEVPYIEGCAMLNDLVGDLCP
jgi:uncharacterized membrane protein (UPF0127 family)